MISELLRAAGEGDLPTLERLLADRPELVDEIGDNPYWGGRVQPLHLAVTWSQGEAVALLLAAGADPSGDNDGYGGWSPLLLAASRSAVGIVEALLGARARVGLFEAAALGRAMAVRTALEAGADRARRTLPDGTTLLHVARTAEIARMALAGGADADAVDAYGGHPLDAALGRAARGDDDAMEVIEALIEAGAEVDAAVWAAAGDVERLDAALDRDPGALDGPGRNGRSPLHAAVSHGRLEIVERLIARGADVDAADSDGVRPLHLAAGAPRNDVELARALLDAGADPALRDGAHDATPASWAEFQRRPELQALLQGARD